MSKSFRYPQLLMVFGAQMHANPLAKRFRAFAQVDCYVEDFTVSDTHQLSLRLLNLVVHPSQNPFQRARVVVLNEIDVTANYLLEDFLIEALKEKATVITENFRLKNDDFWYGE